MKGLLLSGWVCLPPGYALRWMAVQRNEPMLAKNKAAWEARNANIRDDQMPRRDARGAEPAAAMQGICRFC